MGSSTYASPEDGDTMEIIEGRIGDVAAVWSELGWQRVAVMKLNIEGGEYDLLDRMISGACWNRWTLSSSSSNEWIQAPAAAPNQTGTGPDPTGQVWELPVRLGEMAAPRGLSWPDELGISPS